MTQEQVPVAHAYNPSYSGGRDGSGLKASPGKSSQDSHLNQ
jgi:hypothetical protein